MARRRRLNKKVALIGTTVFLLLALAAVVVLLQLNRDPAPFIADGDAAWAAQDYEAARESYLKAYGLTKSSDEKIDLLFKIAEANRELGQWDKVLACWNRIVTSDPRNVKAQLGLLKYLYILADSLGNAGRHQSDRWQEVLTQAGKTLEVIATAGLLNEQKTSQEPGLGGLVERGWSGGAARLGPHLHFVQGRAAFELARLEAVRSPGELLQEAESDLQEAKKLDPGHPRAYRYLAEILIKKGEMAASRGNVDQKEMAERQADDLLAEAVRVAGDVPEAHINLLARKLTLAQRSGVTAAREHMKALEPQYEDLARRFATSPETFAALGQFYSLYAAYLDSAAAREKLDRAIQASGQAGALDSSHVEYLMATANYHYRKSSIYGDGAALNQAIELAEKALALPGAQDRPGPMQFAGRVYRLSVCSLLAKCCLERSFALPKSDPAREPLLARVEKAVHEIRQIHGSGENPEVLKWRGMLELAKDQTGQAVRNLYGAYEQIKAANPPEQRDPFLSYTLAKVFEKTAETGAVIDFLGTALGSGILYVRPAALLDYSEALLRAGSYDVALNTVHLFEERFGADSRSRVLRVQALIAKGHVTEAEKEVAKLNPNDPNTVALDLHLTRAKSRQLLAAVRRPEGEPRRSEATHPLVAELLNSHRREAQLVQHLLQIDPKAVEENHVAELCESLIAHGEAGTAKTMIDAFLKRSPDSVPALFYRGLLSEPDPVNCPPSRRRAIQEQAARTLPDPVRRSLELGLLYQRMEQPDQAMAQFQSVLDATARVEPDAQRPFGSGPPSNRGRAARDTQESPAYLKAQPLSPRRLAAGYLFDLARHQENWPLAGQIAEVIRRENLDDCEGRLFAARLAFARKDYSSALGHLDECLKLRPVYSYGYMLRSDVQAALGKDQEAVEDARKAANLNPRDALVARALAKALYTRNSKLGDSLSSEQRQETRQALERAIQLDPRDMSLLNVYVDWISESEPEKAVALRQTIQSNAPSLDNAVRLGRLATQIAAKETDQTRRKAFFTMAETAFEQARKLDPTSPFMLESYAEYFRARDQSEKAGQLLLESKDRQLLWRHYFRLGKYDEAKKLLERMYQEDGGKTDALKGLVLIAETMSDTEAMVRYSDELLSREDTVLNRLAQIRAYLDMGLVDQAEQKLRGFREKYPGEPRILLIEALIAKQQGQLQRAFELVNRHLEDNQRNAAAWRLRGELSLLRGEPNEAVRDFQQSRTLEDDPVTTVALAKAYLAARRDDQAIEELRAAIRRSEAPPEAGALLEAIYLRLGRTEAIKQLYDEAIDRIDRAIQSAGPDTDSGWEYLARKGHILTTAHNKTCDAAYLEQAVATYESLRSKWPKNSSILNNLAYMLAESNQKLAEALEYARTAMEQNPDEAGYLDTYAYVLHRSGRHAEAAQSLVAAIRQYERRGAVPADVYEHVGLVHEALGEQSKARDAYRRALEVGGVAMPEVVRKRIGSAIERVSK